MNGQVPHRARKRFGQNFLHEKTVIEQIVQTFDPDPSLAIVEIGPGTGALTLPLLQMSENLNVIEIDTDLAQILSTKCKDLGNLKIHIGDALRFDFSTIKPAPLQIIGNLPYNISTPLLFHLLKGMSITKVMVLMLQKEVADRICAEHNQRIYGRLTVMIQSRCKVEKLFDVAPSAFKPAPKVTSSVLRFLPDSERASSILNFDLFEKIVKQAFSQRRKTLRKVLKDLVNEKCLESASIEPTSRAENVSVADYIRLANNLYHPQNQ
jgi:16S rRNA (adenine1518-N6/adenine1519-N6)-dimethyltransferase